MKNLLIILILISGFSAASQDGEKLSKKEKKELKKQAKRLKSNLTELKAMNNELSTLRSDIGRAQQDLNAANGQLTPLKDRISELEGQLAQARAAQPKQAPVRQVKAPLSEAGLIFRVQIGGFKKRDLSDFNDPTGETVKVEANDKGTQEVTLGRFDSYDKANAFKKHLRAMGLEESWIVPFKDGQRVPLKDVVDQLDKGN